jgi:hypothetical protein
MSQSKMDYYYYYQARLVRQATSAGERDSAQTSVGPPPPGCHQNETPTKKKSHQNRSKMYRPEHDESVNYDDVQKMMKSRIMMKNRKALNERGVVVSIRTCETEAACSGRHLTSSQSSQRQMHSFLLSLCVFLGVRSVSGQGRAVQREREENETKQKTKAGILVHR